MKVTKKERLLLSSDTVRLIVLGLVVCILWNITYKLNLRSFVFDNRHTLITIPLSSCLPPGYLLTDRIQKIKDKEITLAQELKRVGAYCSLTNELLGRRGKHVYFYESPVCYKKNQDGKMYEIEDLDIRALVGKYTVIKVQCRKNV